MKSLKKAKEMKKCKHDGEVYSFKINYLFEKHTEFKVCDKCKKVLEENHIESKNTQNLIDLKFAEFRLSDVEVKLQEIEDDYLFRKEKARTELEQVKKIIEDLKLKIK